MTPFPCCTLQLAVFFTYFFRLFFSGSVMMQPYDSFMARYPAGPGLLGMTAPPSGVTPHMYFPRPLSSPYSQPFPTQMHPFTLAERLAGINFFMLQAFTVIFIYIHI